MTFCFAAHQLDKTCSYRKNWKWSWNTTSLFSRLIPESIMICAIVFLTLVCILGKKILAP